MKVVLFCGGKGMRLREFSETIPKPLVPVGPRPIIWNLMRYYAHYGHKDFILCLGHGAEQFKKYFLEYEECMSNDFVLSKGGKEVELLKKDIEDWTITFVDTGVESNIGERLAAVEEHVKGEKMFLANYSDGLSNLPLDSYIETFEKSDAVASFITIPIPHTFHVVEMEDEKHVASLTDVTESNIRINGGFFVLRPEIFKYMREGDELVLEPFRRLIEEKKLMAQPFDGFWRSMDTFKDKLVLDALAQQGDAPWRVWEQDRSGKGHSKK